MIHKYDDNDKHTSIIKHACGFLFMCFSFFYLSFLQGELISKAQYIYSRGATTYSILWGAIIITVLLRLLQLAVHKFIDVKYGFYALTYIPSILLLKIISNVDIKTSDSFSLGWWWIGIPLVLGFAYLLIRLGHYIDDTYYRTKTSKTLSNYLIPNFLILFFSILWCVSCNPSSDVDLYEQKVERLIIDGKYKEAVNVGKKSLNANCRLTNLRMYALSHLGVLPDRLFDYPQYYGIDGLLCITDIDSLRYRIDASDISSYLGMRYISSIRNTTQFFNEAINNQQLIVDSLMGIELTKYNNPDSLKMELGKRYYLLKEEKRRIDDYMLCGLLLERDLEKFKKKLNTSYGLNVNSDSIVPVDSLPKSYREALVMIYPNVDDTLMLKNYSEYLEMKADFQDSTECSNMTRRHFGNTFWWYFDNPNITKHSYIYNKNI